MPLPLCHHRRRRRHCRCVYGWRNIFVDYACVYLVVGVNLFEYIYYLSFRIDIRRYRFALYLFFSFSVTLCICIYLSVFFLSISSFAYDNHLLSFHAFDAVCVLFSLVKTGVYNTVFSPSCANHSTTFILFASISLCICVCRCRCWRDSVLHLWMCVCVHIQNRYDNGFFHQLKFDISVVSSRIEKTKRTKPKPNGNLRSTPKLDNDKQTYVIDPMIWGRSWSFFDRCECMEQTIWHLNQI